MKIVSFKSKQIEFQIGFVKADEISMGGINNLDEIYLEISDLDFLVFKEIYQKNEKTGKLEKVKPKVMNQTKSEKVDLPQQIDTSFNSDMQRVKTAASVGLSLTVILVGQLVSNFFIATSMKEILTSIRMLQIVSFFIYFEISFTPVSKLFLKTINDFAMFKLIPDEQME